MDSEAFAPEPTAESFNSSGSSSSSLSSLSASSSSNDSHIDSSMKNHTSEGKEFKGIGGGSDGGSEKDEFLSGEEECESAQFRPIVGYPDEETLDRAIEEEEIVTAFVDSSEFSRSTSVRPVAKVSEDVDDEENISEDVGLETEDYEWGGRVDLVENLEMRGGILLEDESFEAIDSDYAANYSEGLKENGDSGSKEEAEDFKNNCSVPGNVNLGESGSVLEDNRVDGEVVGDETKRKDENPEKVVVADEAGSNLSNQANSLAINGDENLVKNNGARYIDVLLGLKSSKPDDLQGVEVMKKSEVTSAEDSVGDMTFHDESNYQVKVDYQFDKNVELPRRNIVMEDDENVIDMLLEGLEGEKNIETSVSKCEITGMVEENEGPTSEIDADSDSKQKELIETSTGDLETEPSRGERALVNDGIDETTCMVEENAGPINELEADSDSKQRELIETLTSDLETVGMIEENTGHTSEIEADSDAKPKELIETLIGDLEIEPSRGAQPLVNDGIDDSGSVVESEEMSPDSKQKELIETLTSDLETEPSRGSRTLVNDGIDESASMVALEEMSHDSKQKEVIETLTSDLETEPSRGARPFVNGGINDSGLIVESKEMSPDLKQKELIETLTSDRETEPSGGSRPLVDDGIDESASMVELEEMSHDSKQKEVIETLTSDQETEPSRGAGPFVNGGIDDSGSIVESEEMSTDPKQKELIETLTSDLETEPSRGAQPFVNGGIDDSGAIVESEETDPDKIDQTKTIQPDLILEEEEDKPREEVDIEEYGSEDDSEGLVFGSSKAAEQFFKELQRGSSGSSPSGADNIRDHSGQMDGQIVTDSDEEVDSDEERDGKELFDSAALAALLKAATDAGSNGGPITITSQDGSRLFSVDRPAGLGSSLQSLKPSARPNRHTPFTPLIPPTGVSSENSLSEKEKKKLENLQQMRVKFLRLVQRLGVSMEDPLAAQVLYRMGLFAGRSSSELFTVDSAKVMATELEADGREDLNFVLNILVLGKTGVGKSATINSIFGEEKTRINAFGPGTTTIREIVGIVDGVKIKVFDTPGLKSSGTEQNENRKILSSVKKITKKSPPDIVLYVDRLDSQTRDLNDLPLLRSISSTLGPSIWRSAIVTLTHAASAPPDGPSGSPLSYEVFVAQRSHILQQAIGQASGDLRILNPNSMNPVSLVENHPSCRKNRDGQKVLPNGQTWRPQLLLLCYSIKILAEVSDLSKPQESYDHKKLFGFRVRSPPLPYLLSGLLQSRTHPKLASDQGGEDGDSDTELADLSDSDHEEEEDEFDQLPPFKPLRKAQIAKLSNEQRKAYFDEYDYRVKLLQKKQLRAELKRMKEMKKRGKAVSDDYGFIGEDDQENGAPATVQVPLPDMVLPPSFDGNNPAFRYRFLEPTSQFLARPVLDTHGWDHDCGYDGVNVEHSLAMAGRFPGMITAQITKDKKEFNIHLDSSVAAKHGDNVSTMAGFDIQNVGRQLAYILRGETKFKNFKKNKTVAGISVTFLGENICTGLKIEDQILVGKRIVLVGSTGTVRSQSDSALGANLEVRLREADYPIGQDQSSLGLSLVKWKGDVALGANLQSQFSVGRNYKIAVRAGLNNKMSGQITVRTSSSDQFQIALLAILPIAKTIYKNFWPGSAGSYSIY